MGGVTVVEEEAWSSLDVFCEMIHNKVNKYDTVYPPGLAAPELSAIEKRMPAFISSVTCTPLNMKKGGRHSPMALTAETKVVVGDLPAVMLNTLSFRQVYILGGL